MHEQLRELVKDRLSGAVNCPAKDDIMEEITADLTAKYNDLLAGAKNAGKVVALPVGMTLTPLSYKLTDA